MKKFEFASVYNSQEEKKRRDLVSMELEYHKNTANGGDMKETKEKTFTGTCWE